MLYSDQILHSLARIAIFFGGTDMGWIEEDRFDETAGRLLITGTGLAMDPNERSTGEPGGLDAADLLFQMSGLASSEWLPSALGRTNRIYRDLARSEKAKAQSNYCPVDDWLAASSDGIGIDQQLCLGLLLFGESEPPKGADRLTTIPGVTQTSLDEYSSKLGVRWGANW